MALIDADVYYARLDKKLAGAGAFLTDPSGRVLLVKPNYREHWGWPGGHVDPGESPESTCVREVEEELGLKPNVGRLLVVQWVPPLLERPYALIHFLFDCGTVSDGERVILQAEELDGYGFFTPEDAASLMPPYLVARLEAAVAARKAGITTYLSSAHH